MIGWALYASIAVAVAQGDRNPWDLEPEEEDIPWGEETPAEPDLPAEDPEVPPPPVVTPPPLADEPAGDAEAEERPVRRGTRTIEGHVASGWRVVPHGGPGGVRIGQEFVVGGTGGTNATHVVANWTTGRAGFVVEVPLTAYRTPVGRSTDIGNLQLDGWYALDDDFDRAIGLETHVHFGEPAWTWVNRADDLWPGTGADVVWQMRRPGDTTVIYRASAGLHGAQGYEPFPSSYFRVGAAAALDRAMNDKLGLVGEASIAYWDLSPFEITGLVRYDPMEGARIRGGFVFPAFVWFGLSPSDQRAGVRETTIVIDVSMSL
jgi:hypothetical protein